MGMSPQHQVKVGPDAEAGTARHSDPEPWGGECQEPRWKVEKDQGQGSVWDQGQGSEGDQGPGS